jgi:hypothetical protein
MCGAQCDAHGEVQGMSRIYDAFKTPEREAGPSWFLKTSDDSVYGPVDLSTLADWSRQNRIAPGNKVSTDQEDWTPVETIPELEMIWTLTLANGHPYGPIHLKAAPHLVRQGVVAPDAVLKNRLTGEKLSVKTLLDEEQRQLLLDDFLNTAVGYHEPSDKPAEAWPVKASILTPQAPEPAASPTIQPGRPRIPETDQTKAQVSPVGMPPSDVLESRSGVPRRRLPGLRERFRSLFFFRRGERRVSHRLTRKVQQLQEELLSERCRLLKLREELFGARQSLEGHSESAERNETELAGATGEPKAPGNWPAV